MSRFTLAPLEVRSANTDRQTRKRALLLTGLAITIASITLLSAGVVWLTNGQAVSDPTGLADTTPQAPGLERYVDSAHGFFFDYPAGLELYVMDDGDSRYIFGDTPAGDTRFLITAYPSLVSELTQDHILAQSWASNLNTPLGRVELPSGVTAFVSGRDDEALGVTRDAHFVHGRTAFHVSAVAYPEGLLDELLETWRFVPAPSL